MLVSLLCFDKPGHVDLRMKLRPTHLAWIESTGVKMIYAGPMLSDDGQSPHGSIIIGDFASLEDAKTFSKNDPYAVGGLFEKVLVQPTRQVYPAAPQ